MLLNSPEIRKLESRFISLFQRTLLKGTKGKPASGLTKSVKVQFQSATFRNQMDSIIDDIYLQAIGYADEQLQEIGHGASVTVYSSAKKTLIGNVTKNRYNFVNVAAASDPLPITEEAVKQASGLSETVTKSIVKILKEDGLYLEHPNKLEKRIRDLWGGEKYKAVRFARTFTADVAVNTELFRYQQNGIEDIQFYAKIDGKTSDQCRTLHGTVFRSDSSEAKQYRPPLHFHCLIAGTKVKTPLGDKNIEDVKIGDNVLTHLGNYMPVTDTMSRVSEDIIEISTSQRKIRITSNHPILVKRYGGFLWVTAGNLAEEDEVVVVS